MKTLFFSSSSKRVEPISLIPLINVIFLLLIFFMVAGSIERPETLHVDIPISKHGEEKPAQEVVIYLTPRGNIALDNEVLANNKALFNSLSRKLKENPAASITLRADYQVASTDVLNIMDIIQQAGGDHVTLATQSR